MKTFSFFIFIFLLPSCGSHSVIRRQLSGSDSVLINFNTPQTNVIAKTMATTEKKAIGELIGFVDDKNIQARPCMYDGNILFYAQGQLKGDVVFNYSEDSCRQFILSVDGQLTPVRMSNKAADFLQSLAAGKGWY